MKRRILLFCAAVTATIAIIAATVTTLNVRMGEVIYQFRAEQTGRMPLSENGTVATILNKVFNLNEVDEMYTNNVDNNDALDDQVLVVYNGATAQVTVSGNIARYVDVVANGGHVSVVQHSDLPHELTYTLSGSATDGSFYMDGSLKATVVLDGVSLTNPDSAAINIRNGKRIAIEVNGNNTLVDGTEGTQKACFAVKGHAEFTGAGTLNITGNTAHAYWGKEYVELKKKFTGTINVLAAVGDGFNVNQYFLMNGGTINMNNVGDDGLQLSYKTDDNDVVIPASQDADNTGNITIKGGTIDITTTAASAKGIKAANDVVMSAGTVTVTQSGAFVYDGTESSFCAAVKADGNIKVTGGTINVNSTADGGRGLNANGTITIDQSAATTNIDIKTNGSGGVLEANASGGGGSSDDTPKSYKVYINYSTSGGGYNPGGGSSNLWKNIYLYKSDGTYVTKLTNSVTKSSGYSSYTFYYYDFQAPSNETYYFKSDDYTTGGGWGGGTTYTIISETFTAPSDGNDVYYQVSRDGYTTSGNTRTFWLNDVTSAYGGSSESSEDTGKSYNASGIKADGNITIGGGIITIANSGLMSKSIKSKATVTINGGNLTLSPSGGMKVINNDASYSTGIKALDFLMNGGNVDITVSGQCGKGISAGDNSNTHGSFTTNGGTLNVELTSGATGYGSRTAGNRRTAKGLKADGNMMLNAGTITVATVPAGAKAIKVNGNYTQGTSDGNGPTVTLSTQGGRYGTSGSTGGMGKTTGQGGAAKGIKAEGNVTIYGGETVITTASDGGEGLEGKNGVTIEGGQHFLKCYDDCISSDSKVIFNGGVTVAVSTNNDAVDSNYSSSGAITIGNGAVMAYSSRGGMEEGLDCDNNNRITITGNGYAISAGGSQGGGGWGGSSSSIGTAVQGYYLSTSSISFNRSNYYTLADASGNNLITFRFVDAPNATLSSTLSLFTAKGMVKGSKYNLKYNTTEPTDATTSWHGLYLGSSHQGTTTVNVGGSQTFTAQ